MSGNLVLLLVLGSLLTGILIRIPIAFSVLFAGFLGMTLTAGWDIATTTFARVAISSTSSYTLIVVPLFLAIGVLARQAGIAEAVFGWLNRVLAPLPGGLAMAAIAACSAFAAVSGSSVATVASMGRVAIPEMERHGYPLRVAAGVIGSAGTLGILIPPSIALVIYAVTVGESVGQMLLAGIIPGVLTALAYGVRVFFVGRRLRRQAPAAVSTAEVGGGTSGHTSLSEVTSRTAGGWLRSLRPSREERRSVVEVTLLFAVIVGGIYLGWFTPTESAALGGLLALAIFFGRMTGSCRGRRLTRLRETLEETVGVTGMLFALIAGSAMLTFYFVYEGYPSTIAAAVSALDVPPTLIVLLILLMFIPLGMFLEGLSILLIAVPMVYPTVTALGFDGIWFGVLVIKFIELGLITPPVGLNAFVVSGTHSALRVEEAFRGLAMFIPVDLAVIALLFAMPTLVTWLPAVSG